MSVESPKLKILNDVKAVIEYLEEAHGWGVNYIPGIQKNETADDVQSKKTSLETLRRSDISRCTKCFLSQGRKTFVFGEGNPDAILMFVGEAPGRDEDIQGKPFVGAAGQLLTKIIESIGLKREEVFITNVLKCRPPNNREPEPNEVSACRELLEKQIEIIKPGILCSLGKHATQWFLGNDISITKERGKLHNYKEILLIPTYHPSFLLRNPAMKRPVWEDMKMIRKEYDKILVARSKK